MLKRLLSSLLLFIPGSAFAFAAPRSAYYFEHTPTPPSWVGIGLLAMLLSAISAALLVQAGMRRLLSKNIHPRYVMLNGALLVGALCMIVWTGIASDSLFVLLFNLHGIPAGLLVGVMCSRTRKPITAESIWKNTLFYMLLHG